MERIDDLQINGYRIIQDTDQFCFGTDAVLLADFARGTRSKHTLDLCAGNGVIALILAAKTNTPRLTCIEIQPAASALARRSVSLNGLEGRIEVLTMDLNDAPHTFADDTFDVIVCNPPYMEAGRGLVNPADAKAAARHEISCTLEGILSVCGKLLSFGGHLYFIHKTSRMADVFEQMRSHQIEPKTLRFLHRNAKTPSDLFLIEGTRGGGKELKVLPPLVMYQEDGTLSQEVQRIYQTDGDLGGHPVNVP